MFIVTAGAPSAVGLGNYMKRRRPSRTGRPDNAKVEHFLKLSFCTREFISRETPGLGEDWRSRCRDGVLDAMCWKRVRIVVGDEDSGKLVDKTFHAGRARTVKTTKMRRRTLSFVSRHYRERRQHRTVFGGKPEKTAALKVDQETVVGEEIGSENWLLHLSKMKELRGTKSREVEAKLGRSKSANLGTISCHKPERRRRRLGLRWMRDRNRKNANISAAVH